MSKTPWYDLVPPEVAAAQQQWERRHFVARARRCRLKFREIGALLGVGQVRAAQLFAKYEQNPISPVERYLAAGLADIVDILAFARKAARGRRARP